jgi:hypothetical protein
MRLIGARQSTADADSKTRMDKKMMDFFPNTTTPSWVPSEIALQMRD